MVALPGTSRGSPYLPLFLGMASGIGLALVFFELLPHSLEYGNWGTFMSGIVGGIILLSQVDRFLPHLLICRNRNTGYSQITGIQPGLADFNNNLRRAGYLFALSICLHNFPEGLAMGAGFEAEGRLGLLLAVTIGLHNIPEGMALATLLRAGGLPRAPALLVTILVGLLIPLGALAALLLLNITPQMLSLLLALGASTLLYVIWTELIPQSFKQNAAFTGVGVLTGFFAALLCSLLHHL